VARKAAAEAISKGYCRPLLPGRESDEMKRVETLRVARGKLTGLPKRGGFTLVEVLIVTVIIGIIAGIMMISVGASTDSAIATRLVNDLQVMRLASLQYFLENYSLPGDGLPNGGHASLADLIGKYCDNPRIINAYGGKVYVANGNNGKILYGLSPDNINEFGPRALKKIETIGNVYDEDGNQFKAGNGHDAGPFYIIIK
jgi:prepilin-type N-terminal cleavage/methylation domain-containing protein